MNASRCQSKNSVLGFLSHEATVLLVAASLAFLLPSARAATSQWTGAVDSDWNNAGNWNPGVPMSADEALLLTGGTYAISLSADAAAFRLLSYTGDVTVQAGSHNLVLGSGEFSGLGVGSGRLTLDGGNISNGQLTLGYSTDFNELQFQNGANWQTTTNFLNVGYNGNQTKMTVASGSRVELAGASTVFYISGMTGATGGQNNGVVVTGSSSLLGLNVAQAFIGGGSQASGSYLTVTDGGRVEMGAGLFVVGGNGSSGATLEVSGAGSSFFKAAGEDLRIANFGGESDNQVVVNAGSFTNNADTWIWAGGASTNNAFVSNGGTTELNGGVYNYGRFEVNGGNVNFNGRFENRDSGELIFTGGSIKFRGSGLLAGGVTIGNGSGDAAILILDSTSLVNFGSGLALRSDAVVTGGGETTSVVTVQEAGVTIRPGDQSAPFSGGDTLTVGGLILEADVTFDIRLGAGSASDFLAITGLLDTTAVGEGSLVFNLSGAGLEEGASYLLVAFGSQSGLTLEQLMLGTFDPGLAEGNFSIQSDGIYYTVVPEPSAYALLLGGMGMLFGCRTLRRKQS